MKNHGNKNKTIVQFSKNARTHTYTHFVCQTDYEMKSKKKNINEKWMSELNIKFKKKMFPSFIRLDQIVQFFFIIIIIYRICFRFLFIFRIFFLTFSTSLVNRTLEELIFVYERNKNGAQIVQQQKENSKLPIWIHRPSGRW